MHQLLNVIKEHIPQSGECARLFHGRGKKWEGHEHLSIDFFPPTILITTYKEIESNEKSALVDLLLSIPELSFESIVLQKRHLKNDNVEVLKGEMPAEAFAVEKGERYSLNLKNPQNTGFFLDMGLGREWLRQHSQNKRVLNLFSYTCSLSVAAFSGQASAVANVDMSQPALNIGEKNHRLNGIEIDGRKTKFFHYDIMKSLGVISKRGPYDIVIIDPPTNQGLSFKVERDYHKIIRRLPEMVSEDAVIMACLNSPYLGSDFLLNAFKEHAPEFIFQNKMYASFSDMEVNPEEGLKILFFKRQV